MNDIQLLAQRLDRLEARIEHLEADQVYTEQLYKKARELVIKHGKASIIFLQGKLLIDLDRATGLLDRLQAEGVVGPDLGFQPRKVLLKSPHDPVDRKRR